MVILIFWPFYKQCFHHNLKNENDCSWNWNQTFGLWKFQVNAFWSNVWLDSQVSPSADWFEGFCCNLNMILSVRVGLDWIWIDWLRCCTLRANTITVLLWFLIWFPLDPRAFPFSFVMNITRFEMKTRLKTRNKIKIWIDIQKDARVIAHGLPSIGLICKLTASVNFETNKSILDDGMHN